MKKTPTHRKPIPPEDALARYDWGKAVRGRHAHRFPKDALAVVIAPELRRHFATADAVNDGLRVLLKMATLAKTGGPPKHARSGKRREVA